jgi:beta-mannosidase
MLLLLGLLAVNFPGLAQVQRYSLDDGWEFRQISAPEEQSSPARQAAPPTVRDEAISQWRPATVPGDIHLDLLAQKLIPDPFYGTNEAKLQWISSADWEYRTRVDLPSTLVTKQHLELVFDGLDAYALVYLNDKLVLTANNQFRVWRVDAKPYVKSGLNELRVVFPAQDKAAEAIAKRDPWYPRNTVPARGYVRKAAYEHGWDWGPTFITSGVWRPVGFEGWDTTRIADFHVKQSDVSAEAAHLVAEVEIEASADTRATIEVASKAPGGTAGPHAVTQKALLHSGTNIVSLPIEVAKPQLWFPAGYGAQPLYDFTVTVRIGNHADKRTTRIGLRSLQLRRDVDKWGRSFEFVINGIPIFAKGADVIPSDSFANRVTPEKYRAMLQSAKDANMNMVRLWGGGYYEADEFYNLCDELGIMIWHDFMFGNEWQPGTYDFKLNVEKEAEDQLRRLRNHPSIVLWSGNNETEIGFHWLDRDKLDPAVRLQMWQDYVTLFHGVLARAVTRFDPEVPYWPSSPSADLEQTLPDYQSGDDHIWDVWHGRLPFSTYEQHHARFVSEYGFQSFPEMRTIESFTTPEDRTSIFTDVMLAHQKNNEGNSLIHAYLLRDYPEPKDFASFLYVSQVLQAEGVKIGAEHLRRERPRTMGSIYWQLNDCWPVASWSSIDSFGRWKALQFYAKRFYAPVLVSPHVEDGELAVYVVSDRTEQKPATLVVQHLGFDGKVLSSKTQQVTVPPLASTIFSYVPLTELSQESATALDRSFVVATLTIAGEPVSRNLTYLVPTKQVKLPLPNLNIDVAKDGDGLVVNLRTDALARSVHMVSADSSAVFEDDYFDLLPGETRSIRVKTSAAPDDFRRTLDVRSLANAFNPAVGR